MSASSPSSQWRRRRCPWPPDRSGHSILHRPRRFPEPPLSSMKLLWPERALGSVPVARLASPGIGMGCEPDVIDGRPCDWPDCAASTKCATRRRMTEWSERSSGGPSQRLVEAGGSLALEAQGADGSSPDNDETGRYCQTVWAWQARWEGVARANQWLNPLKRGIGSNLADVGRGAVHACPVGQATLAPEFRGWRGGHEEVCGVLMARLQGKSWAPPPSIGRR
jgi:hypothetical protein